MTRAEALTVARLWHAWDPEQPTLNRTHREFVFSVVADHKELQHLNCFEVLDAVTNEAAWEQLGQITVQEAGA